MLLLLIILSFVCLWYISQILVTYSYFDKRGISFNSLSILLIPIILFKLHLKIARKEKSFKFIKFYFMNYKSSIIFLAELVLENVAMTEAVGYSPHLARKNKTTKKVLEVDQREKRDIFAQIKSLISLPESINSYEKMMTI